VEHSGAWAGFRTDLVRFPEERVSVITLCNVANANPAAKGRAVADIVLAGDMQPAVQAESGAAPSEAELARYAGLYWSAGQQQVLEVERQGGKLMLRRNGSRESRPLTPEGGGSFTALQGEVRLRFEPGGERGLLAVRAGTGREEKYRRVAAARPTAGELRSLAGRYHSPGLQVTWSVAVRDGKLLLRQLPSDPNLAADAPEEELQPAAADVFTGAGLVITFERSGGRVTGLTASSSGAWRLRFQRLR